MNALPNEISSLIALEIDPKTVCNLFAANKQWYKVFSEQFWNQLLLVHFKTSPPPDLNSCQFFHVKTYWPDRVQLIFPQFWSELITHFEENLNPIYEYLFKCIQEAGPFHYNDSKRIIEDFTTRCPVFVKEEVWDNYSRTDISDICKLESKIAQALNIGGVTFIK